MDLLFRPIDPQAEDIRVLDTTFEKHYPAIDTNTRWATIEPFVRQATDRYILPHIGSAMYGELMDHIDEGDEDEHLDTFIGYLRDALAHYAMYHALPKLNVVVGDLGVGQNRPTEGNFNATGQWQYKSTMWALIESADASMDIALSYAEARVHAGDDFFHLYAESSGRSRVPALYRTTDEMQRYVDIRNSRRTFLRVAPYVDIAYVRHIRPVVGDAFYNDLIGKMDAGTLDAKESGALEHIRRALAMYAMTEAIPAINAIVEGDGVRVATHTDFYDSRNNATPNATEVLIARLAKNAATYRADLQEYLYTNADDLPIWKADKYQTDITARRIVTSNERTGGIML
jgi:hypothetical protein